MFDGVRKWLANQVKNEMTTHELADWLQPEGGYYQTSAAGVSVSDQSMMGLPAAYAAVRAVSEVVGSFPLMLLQRNSDGSVQQLNDHPLHDLLGLQPNNYQTSTEFISLMQARLCVRHNAFARIERQGGRVTRIMPLQNRYVDVKWDEQTGLMAYDIRNDQGKTEKNVPPSQMLHLRGFSDNGFMGLAPVHVLRDALGSAVAAERYTQRMMANGAHISGYMRAPGIKEEQRIQVQRQLAEYRGPDNAGKLPLLPGVVEWVKMGMTAQEAEILGTRRFMVEDVARMFRVPPHIIASLDKATYSNIESQSREFMELSIAPWLDRWEQRLRISLLTPAERRRGLYMRFETKSLLRANFLERYQAYQSALTSGWMTANEARGMEDMPALDGLDEPLRPMNMAPWSQVFAAEEEDMP